MNAEPLQSTTQTEDLHTATHSRRRTPGSGTKTKLPHAVIVRAPGLLPMWYTPSEIEEELGVDARLVRDWITHGLEHRRDERGHIWINGHALAAWVAATKDSKKRPTSRSSEAYCVRCNLVVEIHDSKTMRRGRRSYLQGICPVCCTPVYRGIKND